MSLALDAASTGRDQGEVPVGAVLVLGETLLAQAGNQRECNLDPTAHAEVVAIRQAAQKLGRWNLSDCTLYVTLEPCPMCMGAILLSRIPRLVCGTRNHKLGSAGSVLPLHDFPGLDLRCQVTHGVLQERCAGLLTQFFQQQRP